MSLKKKKDENLDDDQNGAGATKSSISEAVYKEIARLNGQINSYSKDDLMAQLKKCRLNTQGHTDVLKKRLKIHYRNKKLASSNILTIRKLYPYYVVIDFEATCNTNNPDDYPFEIIEFPAVLVNTEKMIIKDCFQFYVKPVLNPRLSDFCIQLTGITQEQVDSAEEFPQVLNKFEAWLKRHKLGTKHKYMIVTDGPWDMRRFLYGQCLVSNVPYPSYAKKWVNIRKLFAASYNCRGMRLQLMLDHLGLEFEGRPHCGLDDAKNIAHILLRMIEDEISIEHNERYYLNSRWLPKIKIPTTSVNETTDTLNDLNISDSSLKTYTETLLENRNQCKKSTSEIKPNGCKSPC